MKKIILVMLTLASINSFAESENAASENYDGVRGVFCIDRNYLSIPDDKTLLVVLDFSIKESSEFSSIDLEQQPVMVHVNDALVGKSGLLTNSSCKFGEDGSVVRCKNLTFTKKDRRGNESDFQIGFIKVSYDSLNNSYSLSIDGKDEPTFNCRAVKGYR